MWLTADLGIAFKALMVACFDRQEIWANVTDPKKLSELAFGRLVSARACIATKSGPEDIHSCMKDAMDCASKVL